MMSRPPLPAPRRPAPAALPRVALVVVTAAVILSLAAPAAGDESSWPARGYQPRACGFDMDRDGLFGEPEDCRVCDGLTADPDDDGVFEDIYYVDCGAGVNSPICGSAAAPCRTIEYAWNTRADGPDDGAEDILCFRGTCTTLENFSPDHGGVDGPDATYTVPRRGSQVRHWQYPKNPTLLAGWDSDGDGVYPPLDPDDVAVLDGLGKSRAFRLDSNTDYLQMAHFTVRRYGVGTTDPDSGFVRFGPSSGLQTHQVFHDLRLDAVNRDRGVTSETILLNFFPTNAVPQWILFDNLDVPNNGQWFARGASPDSIPDGVDMGPFRFTNITRTAHSCNVDACGSNAASTGFKLWGFLSGVEILDSIFDGNVAAWDPKPNGGPPGTSFVFVDACTQDWMVRNNEVIDIKLPFRIKGFADGCKAEPGRPARAIDEIDFDANYVRNTYEPYRGGDHGVRIEPGGDSPNEWVEDVRITNNVMTSTTGWEAAVWSYAGHDLQPPDEGTIVIADNTFYGDINRHAAIVLGNIEGADQLFPHQEYLIENNIIGGFEPGSAPDIAVYTTFPAISFVSRSNVYDPGADFVWNDGSRRPLTSWRAVTGEDTSSVPCTPLLASPATGDFSLRLADTCARDRGQASAATPARDLDGGPRVTGGALDIGADELPAAIFADGFEGGFTPWSVVSP